MPPIFSVIIPIYNREHLMDETVQSVLDQSYPHWECILVDDGSQDGSWGVIQEWVKRDARIRGVQQENKERSAARNHGARQAKGNWLCFLDSDDCYLPDFLAVLAENIQSSPKPPALWLTGFYIWDGQNCKPAEMPIPKEPLADWLCQYPATPSRVCVEASAFFAFCFREDIVIVEDTVLWVQLLNRFRLGYLPQPLMKYRVHAGNSVHSSSRAIFKRHQGLLAFFKTPESGLISSRVKRFLMADVLFKMADWERQQGNTRSAVRYLLLSLWYQPLNKHTPARMFNLASCIPGFSSIWNTLKP
jgi:glycosyltransferase involved in cell wall biosynthesis